MNKFWLLIKNNLNCLLGSLQGKKTRKSTNVMLAFLILGGFLIGVLIAVQGLALFQNLSDVGIVEIAFFNGFLISFCMMAFVAVMNSSVSKNFNDMDLLLSMPISKSTIALAKSFSKYLFYLFFALVVLIPYTVLFFIFTSFSLTTLLRCILLCLILPLLALGLTYIFDYIISRFFNKSKYASLIKISISTILTLAVLVLMLILIMGYQNLTPESASTFTSTKAPITWLFNFVMFGNILDFFFALLLCFVPFGIGVVIYAKNLGKNFGTYNSKSNKISFKTNSSVLKSLFVKELKNYINTPIYLLNTIIGPVLILIFSVALSIAGKSALDQLVGMDISPLIGLLICGFFAFCIAMTQISTSSISLEGRNLWVLKSSPISSKTVIFSKTLVNIVMLVPVVLFSTILLTITLGLDFTTFMVILFFSSSLSVLISFLGVFINLLLPKLEWDSEEIPVKRGMSTLFGMLAGMLLMAIPIVLSLVLPFFNFAEIGFICIMIYAVLIDITTYLLLTKGIKLFDDLS